MLTLLTLLLLIIIYYSFRYAWFLPTIDYSKPRILMYHMIAYKKDGAKFNSLRVSPVDFERQIKYLKDNNFTSFTMSELVKLKKVPRRSVVITFDDGYEDNFIKAFPILRKYGFKATIYLIINRENNNWSIHRRAKNLTNELVDEPKLQNEQIKQMLESGLIEIGAHTLNHLNFQKLTLGKTREEIEESKKAIEEEFKIECKTFAYPFGIYKDNDHKIVKELGFTSAVTTNAGISDITKENPFMLKRLTIRGKDNFLAFILKMKNGKRGLFK